MELGRIAKGSSKAQLMTIIMLILFMLMLSVLFALAQLNVTSNNIVQSLSLSSVSNNYGNLFRLSANNFAKESLDRALITLANYEYNPALRKGNLISNLSLYVSNLMVSGILPGDTSGYPKSFMGNLTLASYNGVIVSLLGFVPQIVIVNETTPQVFQTSPYSISVSYTERIFINASGNNYRYNIPVNVSVPLNNTPDLFYAQQGILRPIKMSNVSNLTSVVGGVYATSGSTQSYGYGSVFVIPSSQSSGPTCPLAVPPKFSSAPLSNTIIIVTYNAFNLGAGSCIESYGGLITYIPPPTPPAIAPYLVYPSSSGILGSLTSGMRVLVYGPGLATLNIENLRNAIMNHNYFASPFTSAYIDRANAQFSDQSPNGIFTFSNYDTQVGNFNGASYVDVGNGASLSPSGAVTISAWVRSNDVTTNQKVVSADGYELGIKSSGSNGAVEFWTGGTTPATEIDTAGSVISNYGWNHLVATYDGATRKIYVNGVLLTSSATTGTMTASTDHVDLGKHVASSTFYLTGQLSNVQIYNTALSPQQIYLLYTEGISGLPITSNNLAGWWPLNGNANDMSGNGNIGVPSSVSFTPPLGYLRDSIINTPVSTTLSPLPGILSCTNNANCGVNSIPQLYLGYMPLEPQSGSVQTAFFNGSSSILIPPSTSLSITGPMSISYWVELNNLNEHIVLSKCIATCASANIDYLTEIYNSKASFQIGTSEVQESTALSAGTFYNIVIAIDGSAAHFYLNGVPDGSPALALLPTNGGTVINIGKWTGTSSPYFMNGILANMQVYSLALSAAQVQALYQEGIEGVPYTANLMAWWPLDGNANDYSSYNNGVPYNVIYPYFAGSYAAPGMSTTAAPSNEWQVIGLANT